MTASAGTGWSGDTSLGSDHVGLFSRLRGRAYEAIKGMCLARAVNGKATNEFIGLGYGQLSYCRERKRLHMSAKFAFDVSRAPRGVMIDFGEGLDPEYRPGAAVRKRRLL